ncbi:acid phosphatase AphA, partial [Escherichia coli]|nr:acid phosphatase AphA [Escherichia coli]
NDILDARKANAEGIRVLRALNSTYIPLPVNGKFGEKVVINSQY